jgi:starvation-inducible DNA-binding protein
MTEEQQMSKLGDSMKVVLADTFTMYMMAHKYHFNVEGRDFFQLHKLFGKIYEELWESVDVVAEHIRALDEYVPFNYSRLVELSSIEDDSKIPTAAAMVQKLLVANDAVIKTLQAALEQAKISNDEGVINFLGERLEVHAKHGWFLRATTKTNRE